ncbi:MAG: hypothetical protein Q9183_005528, partial [Haloplaca sp. 2 TL-2023]
MSFVVRLGEHTEDNLTAQSTAMRTLEEHISSSAQLYDTFRNLSLQILRDLPGAEYVETSIHAPRHRLVEGCERLVLDLAYLDISNQDPIKETGRSSSQWKIPIRFEEKKELETFGIRFSVHWQKEVKQSGQALHPLQSKGDYAWSSPSADNSTQARNGLNPLLDLHFRLAEWIQGKVHASYEALGLEHALYASDVFNGTFGPGRATLFGIRIGDLRRETNIDIDMSPRPRIGYLYSASQLRRFRSAITRCDVASTARRAIIALGSNVGDRISMIEQACRAMNRRGIKVLHQDQLTKHKVGTTLSPHQLLDQLKAIEDLLGRVKTVENGPRSIDLDILLYDKELVQGDRLQIPHPRISEREFVLRPLC